MTTNSQVRHGNYHNYYSFRVDDTRSDILRTHLEGLLDTNQSANNGDGEVIHVLDVGCNAGVFTDKIYRILRDVTHRKVRVIGIDIDAKLCEQASSSFPEIEFISGNVLNIATCPDSSEVDPIARSMQKLEIEQFDVVCCFSVLMYVHLNGGDTGLRAVLNYLCSKGELLILELQSWRKYRDQQRRLKRDGQEEYSLYAELQWRGGCGKLEGYIKDYIVAKGFELLESDKRSEFDRQLLFFKKKEEVKH